MAVHPQASKELLEQLLYLEQRLADYVMDDKTKSAMSSAIDQSQRLYEALVHDWYQGGIYGDENDP